MSPGSLVNTFQLSIFFFLCIIFDLLQELEFSVDMINSSSVKSTQKPFNWHVIRDQWHRNRKFLKVWLTQYLLGRPTCEAIRKGSSAKTRGARSIRLGMSLCVMRSSRPPQSAAEALGPLNIIWIETAISYASVGSTCFAQASPLSLLWSFFRYVNRIINLSHWQGPAVLRLLWISRLLVAVILQSPLRYLSVIFTDW